MSALTIAGDDARTTYGFVLATPTGWRGLTQQRQTAVIPGRAGARALSDPIVQPRRLTLSGLVRGTSASDARTKLDKLAAALSPVDGVTVSFGDDTTRELVAVLDGITVTAGAYALGTRDLAVDIAMTCLEPFARDVDETSVTITLATRVALPLGTAPVRPTITTMIAEAATTATFALRTPGGTVLGTLIVTTALAVDDVLVVDCDAQTVTLNGDSIVDTITSGDFFTLDVVSQGDYAASSWPTLAAVTGGAAPVVTYKKRWLL